MALIAMGIAALAAPFWGIFTFLAGLKILRTSTGGTRGMMVAGAVLIVVNFLYLLGLVGDKGSREVFFSAPVWLLSLFFAGRMTLGSYWVAASRRRPRLPDHI